MLITIHLTALVLTVLVILYTDHEVYRYVRGHRPLLHPMRVRFAHYSVYLGLAAMILSGFYMALPAWDYYLSYPPFLVKMGFVGVLVLNSFFVTYTLGLAVKVPFEALTVRQRTLFFLSGIISAMAWAGALITAVLFLG